MLLLLHVQYFRFCMSQHVNFFKQNRVNNNKVVATGAKVPKFNLFGLVKKITLNMRLAFQLASLINVHAAVRINHNNSSNGLLERSGESVFVYPAEHNGCYHTWEYFEYECHKDSIVCAVTTNIRYPCRVDTQV